MRSQREGWGRAVMGLNESSLILKAEAQLMRAAQFRNEAAFLLERASASPDSLIHDSYVSLAGRWTAFAASLEVEASYQLSQDAAQVQSIVEKHCAARR